MQNSPTHRFREIENPPAPIQGGGAPPTDTAGDARQSIIDATAYPILTEDVSYGPSPTAVPSVGAPAPMRSGGSQALGQVAATAVSDVLGWKTNSADPKGFLGALTQAFTLTDVEGHVESNWNPRTYTVLTDLNGSITGAQASLYTRAKDAQDQCLPLLDGLYPLDPDADPEYVKALREMAKSQIAEIVKQFAVVPPSILRVDTYFRLLLGRDESTHASSDPSVESDPDEIKGSLGDLRDIYGIWFQKWDKDHDKRKNNPFSNSVEDEQDITNFRVISDYLTSLLQTWRANKKFFELTTTGINAPAFLGTQLVLLSRQFNVIVETVNELRFTLDSVFIGPNERQQLLLEFHHHHPVGVIAASGTHGHHYPAMYLEDLLREIETFMSDEGPRLIRDGGRIAVGTNLKVVVQEYVGLVGAAKHPKNKVPDGYRTPRVQHSLDDLEKQLIYVGQLADQVGTPLPRRKELI